MCRLQHSLSNEPNTPLDHASLTETGIGDPFPELQYAQRVVMDFPIPIGPVIHWLYISVATLVKLLRGVARFFVAREQRNMRFKIHPSIGVARVGNSPEFYLEPETIGGRPIEC